MSTDLHHALAEIAGEAAGAAEGPSADLVLAQRRRRRTVRRSIGAGGIAAAGVGIAVVAGALGGPADPPVLPSTPTPSPTVSPSPAATPVASPVCGDTLEGVPVELTLTAEPEQTLGGLVIGAVEAEDDVLEDRTVWLALLSDGVLVASTEPGIERTISAALDSCGGALAAGEYELAAVADGEEGAITSAPVPVRLTEPATPAGAEPTDPSASWAPLPSPNDPYWNQAGDTSYTSDMPGATQPLADGRYYAELTDLDVATRSFDARILVQMWGEDALVWARANAPETMVWVDGRHEINGLPLVNLDTPFGTQRMTVPADAAIYGWCIERFPDYDVRTLDQLRTGDPGCGESTRIAPGSQDNFFWLDVRGGEIRQMIGAFIS